ncbi:MAG: efflux RND transporter periplasmic adaptor subunit [Lachnospiraceae bacterium]|nr:efflux RND transporter periplasmic adaptor subunit [Lachnospiraceae bacterium]
MIFGKRHFNTVKRMLVLGLSFVMLLSGCGKNAQAEPEIELIDPVSSANVTETAVRRTILKYEVLDGGVFPVISEYSTASGMKAADIGFFPGQSVFRGSVLFSGDMQDYIDQEKATRDALDELVITYAENWRVNHFKLEELNEFIRSRSEGLENNPTIAIIVQRTMFERDLLKQTMEDDEAIYMLDAEHYNTVLSRLIQNEAKRRVTSYMNGTVVAVSNASPGAQISEGTNVSAVTDGHSINILADYRSAREIGSAIDVYAVVDGKRYEIEYIPYSASEYNALKASGSDVYSVFRVNDPEGNISAGQKASVVVLYDKKENILSVSNESIHRDSSGFYVNLSTGDKAYITKGITDGMFTEVLSGVNEGDVILLDSYNEAPENVATLSRGDYYLNYEGTGYLYYPDITNVTNNVKYGTVTMTEKKVTEGQRVKKGEVIAYVTVTPDSVKLEELSLKLLRLNEKRVDAQEAADDPNNDFLGKDVQEKLNNAVASLDRQIASVTEQINEIQSAYSVTAFTSPVDGVIGYITDLSDGSVLKANERIATVAATSAEYLYAMNEGKSLLYGMEMTGEYTNPATGETVTFPLTVSSVSFGPISKELSSDRVYVMPVGGVTLPGGAHDPDAEISADIPAGVSFTPSNPWEEWVAQQEAANAPAKQSYKLTGYLQYESDVILVPAKAVTIVGKQAYVTVLENGTYVKKGFIAGGINPVRSVTIDGVAYIWAIDGLEEGMVIVY